MNELDELVGAITVSLVEELEALNSIDRLLSEQNYGMAKEAVRGVRAAIVKAIENFKGMQP